MRALSGRLFLRSSGAPCLGEPRAELSKARGPLVEAAQPRLDGARRRPLLVDLDLPPAGAMMAGRAGRSRGRADHRDLPRRPRDPGKARAVIMPVQDGLAAMRCEHLAQARAVAELTQ